MSVLSLESLNVFNIVENESASYLQAHLNEISSSDNESLKRFLNQRNVKNQTPLHVTCFKLHLEKTQILLESGANANLLDQDRQTPAFLVIRGLQTCNCDECKKKALGCLALLSHYHGRMDQADVNGRTALSLCAEYRFVECAKAILLNQQNISNVLGGNTASECSMIGILAEKIPGVLETVFDLALKPERKSTIDDPDYMVTFDLGILTPRCSGIGEMSFLKKLLKNANRDHDHHQPNSCILRHPLIAVFLDIKWKALERWYIAFLVYQILSLLTYTSLIGVTVFYDCPYQTYIELRQASHENRSTDSANQSCKARTSSQILGGILILNATYILYHELRRGFHDFHVYKKNVYHYLILLGYVTVIFTMSVAITLDHTTSIYAFFYPTSAFAISMFWCQMFVQIGRLPTLAIYVEMLVKITADFCKTLAIYSFLLVGFAISFCILYNKTPQLYHFPLSITKTLSMLVGELDHETLLNAAEDNANPADTSNKNSTTVNDNMSTVQWIGAYIWYVGVVVMVTLVLMNLLVGLAVSDIQGIRDNAELYAIKRRIRFIAYIEQLFVQIFRLESSKRKPNCLNCIKNSVCPVEFRKFTITVYPNDPKFKEVSQETKRTIKQWIVSSLGVPDILRQCKGSSPDSSSTLRKVHKRHYSEGPRDIRRGTQGSVHSVRDIPNQTIKKWGDMVTEFTDSERIGNLERMVEQMNENLEAVLEGVYSKS